MIRVAIVDDHHAMRLGLQTALRGEPGLVPVGVASNAAELEPLLYRTQPDVVLLDFHLPDGDGLAVCRRIKAEVPAPAVVLYSAFAGPAMTVPAIVAGADGVVHKGVGALDLFDALRRVARGETAMPPVSEKQLENAASSLEPDDLPILGMLMDRTPPAEIASTLRLDGAELTRRVKRMITRLSASLRSGFE